MKKTRDEIFKDVVELLQELAEDWDYSRPIAEETLLFSELGFESLSAVVLGTMIQQRYEFEMPFAELLADVGQRDLHDLSIRELVDFVDLHLNSQPKESRSA